jgi:hypothetical protein
VLVEGVAHTSSTPVNVMRVTLHPDGLARAWRLPQWVDHLLGSLRRRRGHGRRRASRPRRRLEGPAAWASPRHPPEARASHPDASRTDEGELAFI